MLTVSPTATFPSTCSTFDGIKAAKSNFLIVSQTVLMPTLQKTVDSKLWHDETVVVEVYLDNVGRPGSTIYEKMSEKKY